MWYHFSKSIHFTTYFVCRSVSNSKFFLLKVAIFSFLLFFLFSLFMTTEHLLDNSVFSCQSIHGFNLIYRNPGSQFSATLLSTPCKFWLKHYKLTLFLRFYFSGREGTLDCKLHWTWYPKPHYLIRWFINFVYFY